MSTENAGSPRIVAGRYELRDRLGRGGMGAVWSAWDIELGREVAIKEVLVPEELPAEEREAAYARVRREARSAARLSDEPGVVTVYDVLDDRGHPWVVMRLVQGRSLHELLEERGPLPPVEASRVAAVLVRTLKAAHDKGIVHRDVKPGNVMLANDGSILLTDFGIATVEGETAVTRTGTLVGSPEFLAPERMDTDTSGQPPSDLWSLGITLYTAIEGSSPFHRETLAATLAAVVSAPIPPPTRAGALAPIIMGLLERDPARRLTADQVSAMLDAADAATPRHGNAQGGTGPPPAPRPGLSGPSAALRDWRVWAALGAVLVLVAMAGVYRWLIWPEPAPLYADYERTDDELSYELRYPAEWEVSESDDWRTSFANRDAALDMRMAAGAYRLDTPIGEGESPGAREELTRLTGPAEGHGEYAQSLMDTQEVWTGEAEWDVALLEESFTWDEAWLAENQEDEPEWVEPERFGLRLQAHPPGTGDWVFWMSWQGPQSERGRYDGIIRETLSSFDPEVS